MGAAVEVMTAAEPGPSSMKLSGCAKFGWFSKLKNSARNSTRCRSVMANCLRNDTSEKIDPGPSRMFRPALPYVKSSGMGNAFKSNQLSGVRCPEGRLPFAVRLERTRPCEPVFEGSKPSSGENRSEEHTSELQSQFHLV